MSGNRALDFLRGTVVGIAFHKDDLRVAAELRGAANGFFDIPALVTSRDNHRATRMIRARHGFGARDDHKRQGQVTEHRQVYQKAIAEQGQ